VQALRQDSTYLRMRRQEP